MRRVLPLLIPLLFLALGRPTVTAADRQPPSDRLFGGTAPLFDIQVDADQADQLRREPRTDVPASVKVGPRTYSRVGVRLKGAAGSFRDFDDRPALTLNFDRFVQGQRCQGVEKLHLNNSVQDESLLSESLASRLYLESGVPTARAGHAVVRLNGRDLGVYVLKEGYDNRFLRRHFPTTDRPPGNLYDGGFLQDIDQRLDRDAGRGPDDHSDLRQLRKAANTPVARRAAALEAALDVDRFLTFVAVQALTDDWDGYARNRNNYRLYFDPASGQAVFIPHGMDQLFNDPGAPVTPDWGGLVARRLSEVPSFQVRYDQRLRDLLEQRFHWTWISAHLADVRARLEPAFAGRPAEEREAWHHQFQRQSNRIAARLRNVRRQLGLPPDPGLASLGVRPFRPRVLEHWTPRSQDGDSRLEQSEGPPAALHLVAERRGTVASFRTSTTLPSGAYRFEARARTTDLTASRGESPGRGAGIRISGASRTNQLVGTQDWTSLQFDFEVDEEREVEFVVEIRADQGEAWFDRSSLRLIAR